MVEHYTKAVVLSREPRGELDVALTLYTKDFGKIIAKVKSIRRITSKLSGHLTPGAIANVRIIEMNGSGHQVVDALSSRVKVTLGLLRFLDFINKLTPTGLPDLHLWHELESALFSCAHSKRGSEAEALLPPKATYRRVISIMGYDAKNAFCYNCGGREIAYFVPCDIMFLCGRCFHNSGIKENEAFSI